ncbi:MAG: hypothetical protein WD844_05730 [Thermoleophilaceae bacterium]
MRRAGAAILAVLLAVLAVGAVILFFQSRDESTVEPRASVGEPYRGEPVLSPALADAVDAGNVVVLHRDARPPEGTASLREGAGPELANEGLAVLLEREPALDTPLAAVSADRIQHAERPDALGEFVDFHLGRAGAP